MIRAHSVFSPFLLLFVFSTLLFTIAQPTHAQVEGGRGTINETLTERADYGASEAERIAAAQFVPMVGIPYIESEKVETFGDYVNAFYFAAISIAAFLAVVRIIFAGVKYMLSDIVTDKQTAKKDIRAALLGLLIVIGAVLILNTINQNLTEIRLFSDAPILNIQGGYEELPVNPCVADPASQACRDLRAASCEDGQEFVVSDDDPSGSCITPIDLGDEDYTDDPEEGRVACAPLSYDPRTNSCIDINVDIVEIPTDLYETWVENSDGDDQWVISDARSYCSANGMTYSHVLRGCLRP